jgi:hypothetical protein
MPPLQVALIAAIAAVADTSHQEHQLAVPRALASIVDVVLVELGACSWAARTRELLKVIAPASCVRTFVTSGAVAAL